MPKINHRLFSAFLFCKTPRNLGFFNFPSVPNANAVLIQAGGDNINEKFFSCIRNNCRDMRGQHLCSKLSTLHSNKNGANAPVLFSNPLLRQSIWKWKCLCAAGNRTHNCPVYNDPYRRTVSKRRTMPTLLFSWFLLFT